MAVSTRPRTIAALCGTFILLLAVGCSRKPAPRENSGVREDVAGLQQKLNPSLPLVAARWREMDRAKVTGAPSADTVVYAYLTLDEKSWLQLAAGALGRTGTVALPSDIAKQLLPTGIQTTPTEANGINVAGPLYDVASLSTAHYGATVGVRVGSALLLTVTGR